MLLTISAVAASAFDRDLFSFAHLDVASLIASFHEPTFKFADHVEANDAKMKAMEDALLAHPEPYTGVEFKRMVAHLRLIHGNVKGTPILALNSKQSGKNLYTSGLLDDLLISPAIFHAQVRFIFAV